MRRRLRVGAAPLRIFCEKHCLGCWATAQPCELATLRIYCRGFSQEPRLGQLVSCHVLSLSKDLEMVRCIWLCLLTPGVGLPRSEPFFSRHAERGDGGQPDGRAAARVRLPALLQRDRDGRQGGLPAQVRPEPVRRADRHLQRRRSVERCAFCTPYCNLTSNNMNMEYG